MNSYTRLDKYLGNREEKLVKSSNLQTRALRRNDSTIAIRLVETDIVTFLENGDVVLNSGGWKTQTTKRRINDHLPVGWGLYQEKREWYLYNRANGYFWDNKDNRIPFADGITIHADGSVSGIASSRDLQSAKDMRKKIKVYSENFVKALFAGEVDAPSGGDCWYCCMVTNDGGTLGDQFKDVDHLLSHLDEPYYVPTLLYNAVEEGSVSRMAKWTIQECWDKTHKSTSMDDVLKDQIVKALRKYLEHRLV